MRLFFFFILGVLAVVSCRQTPVSPNLILSDTTSHNFVWTIDTLGDGGSSVLNDVAIINDTLIYAVGEIYLKDSAGQIDPLRYNIAIWNGVQWRIQRLPYNYQGQQFVHPIQAVFAKGADDIWFGGNGVIHWNGLQFIDMPIPSGVWGTYRVNKIWGNGQETHIVGDGGSLAHFDGSTWSKIESGTGLPMNDIWGSMNPVTREITVLCVASNRYLNEGKKLLKISGLSAKAIPDSGLSWSISGVWFDSGSPYYVVGAGVGKKNVLDSTLWSVSSSGEITTYYTNAVRGTRSSDVVVAGAFGEILHFNGSTWRSFHSMTQLPTGTLYSASIKGNMIIAVGQVDNKAVAAIGKRL